MVKPVNNVKDYKYKVLYLLNNLNIHQKSLAYNFLVRKIGIPKSTFNRWIYTKEDARFEIPGRALLVIADYFGVKPHELFKEELETTNPQEIIEFNKKHNLDVL